MDLELMILNGLNL